MQRRARVPDRSRHGERRDALEPLAVAGRGRRLPQHRSRDSRRHPPGAERPHGPPPRSVPRAPHRCGRGGACAARDGHGVAGGAPWRRGRARGPGYVRGGRAAPARRGPRDSLRPGPRRVPESRGRARMAHRARRAHAGQVHAARRSRGQNGGTLMTQPETEPFTTSLERMNRFQEPEARVIRPGGRIVVKESQLLHGVFLPGHPALERRLRQAEMEWSRHEGGEFSFEERRQRTLASLRAAGLSVEGFRTYLLDRRAPLPHAARDYIQRVVFERNWGPRLRDRLDPDDWTRRSALCEAESATFLLDDPDYYCLYPISVLVEIG